MLFYTETVNAGDTDNDLTALADPQVTQQNSHHLLNRDSLLLAAYGLGTSMTTVRMETPKLREFINPNICPVDRAAVPPDEPNVCFYSDYELMLRAGEEISVKASNNLGAATEQATVIIWTGDRPASPSPASIYTLRCTYSITGILNGFASGSLTFTQTLPTGRYEVVGMHAFGTALVAARLILPGFSHRPGVVAGATAGLNTSRGFRKGQMGVFGEFTNVALPAVEIFTNAAGASTGDVYLDLIQRGRF